MAKIWDTPYATVAEAFTAANADGKVVEILKAWTYELPATISNNITIKGNVNWVIFAHNAKLSWNNIANVPNWATFENVTFNLTEPDSDPYYHGFGYSDISTKVHNISPIIFTGCEINGEITTYWKTEFYNTTFNITPAKSLWNVWVRYWNVKFDWCTFNGYDRNIHLHSNTAAAFQQHRWEIEVNNCTFWKSQTKTNKAAVIVKEIWTRTVTVADKEWYWYPTQYDVIINNSKIKDGDEDKYWEWMLWWSKLFMVDYAITWANADHANQYDYLEDAVAWGVYPWTLEWRNVVVTLDGKEVYATPSYAVAKIWDTPYASLANAIANVWSSATTIQLVKDTAEDVEIPALKIITLDLNGHTLSNVGNYTITNNWTLTISWWTVVSTWQRAILHQQGSLTINGWLFVAPSVLQQALWTVLINNWEFDWATSSLMLSELTSWEWNMTIENWVFTWGIVNGSWTISIKLWTFTVDPTPYVVAGRYVVADEDRFVVTTTAPTPDNVDGNYAASPATTVEWVAGASTLKDLTLEVDEHKWETAWDAIETTGSDLWTNATALWEVKLEYRHNGSLLPTVKFGHTIMVKIPVKAGKRRAHVMIKHGDNPFWIEWLAVAEGSCTNWVPDANVYDGGLLDVWADDYITVYVCQASTVATLENQYTVTFNKNGGNGWTNFMYFVTWDPAGTYYANAWRTQTISTVTPPTKNGATFLWYKASPSCNGSFVVSSTWVILYDINHNETWNVEYYACWSTDEFALTIDTSMNVTHATYSNPQTYASDNYPYDTEIELKNPTAVDDGYEFKWWTVNTGDVSFWWQPTQLGWTTKFNMPAYDVTVTANVAKKQYTVTWNYRDGSGNVVVETGTVEHGEVPNHTALNPLTYQTVATWYTFSSWSPTPSELDDNAEYTAQYDEATRTYTITWNVEWTETADTVAYGATPAYSWTPAKPETTEYTYTFNGWDPEVIAVTGAQTYIATFTASPKGTCEAKINNAGDCMTVNAAITAATDGQTVNIIKAWNYTLPPEISHAITVKWDVEGVVFTHSASTSHVLSTLSNDVIFDNVTFRLTDADVNRDHWFRHDGNVKVTIKNSTVDGSIWVLWDMLFDNVTFTNDVATTYNVTVQLGDVTFSWWTIIGKWWRLVNLFNYVSPTLHTIHFKWTRFVNEWDLKYPAIVVRETQWLTPTPSTNPHNDKVLKWVVKIDDIDGDSSKISGYFPVDQLWWSKIWTIGNVITSLNEDWNVLTEQQQSSKDMILLWSKDWGEVKVYVDWNKVYETPRAQYTVTFDSDGWSDVASQNVYFGWSATTPAVPTKIGYTLVKWHLTGEDTAFDFSTSIKSNITLYAEWTGWNARYSVEHWKQLVGSDYDRADLWEWNSNAWVVVASLIPSITKKEYVGYKYKECISDDTIVAGNNSTIIRCYYDKLDHTVTFDADGWSPVPTDKTIGNYWTVEKPADPTKDWYTFVAWQLSGVDYDFDAQLTGDAHRDVTLKATWTADTHNVIFHGNWWEGTMSNLPVTYGEGAVALTANGFTRNWYSFSKWNTQADGSGTNYAADAIVSNLLADLDLYAQWTAGSVTVTYDANGWDALAPASKDVTFDGVYGDLPTPTWAGHEFAWWFTDGGTEVTSGTQVTNKDAHNIIAHWTTNNYVITFNNEDWSLLWSSGFAYWTNPLVYGGETPTKADSAWTRYTFDKWTDGSSLYASDNLPEVVWAAVYTATYITSDCVAKIGDTCYALLSDAVSSATDWQEIVIQKDITLPSQIGISAKGVTIDLNGHTISREWEWTAWRLFYVYPTWKLTLTWAWVLSWARPIQIDWSESSATNSTIITVWKDVTLKSFGLDAGWILVFYDSAHYANGVVINFAWTIEAEDHWISINWNILNWTTSPILNIESTASITSDTGVWIYNAGYWIVNVADWANIEWLLSAIEIRAWELTIEWWTFTSTASSFEINSNGNWPTVTWAAIVISQHTTNQPVSVTINGWAFNGVKAVYEEDIEDTTADDSISLSITDGTFNGEVASENETKFIEWWTFSEPVDVEECADSFIPSSNSAWYTVERWWKVTYLDKDGSWLDLKAVRIGGTALSITAPTEANLTFKEWQLSGSKYNFEATVTRDITLDAVYTAEVVFDSNGGTHVDSQTVAYSWTAIAPSVPEKSGHSFQYWYLDDENTEFDFANVKLSGDITLLAKWNVVNYTISFIDNDDTPLWSSGFDYNTIPTFGLAYPTKDSTAQTGYTFTGWTIDGTVVYPKDGDLLAVTWAATYKAVYAETLREYIIEFDANGWTPVPSEQSIPYNWTWVEPTPAPELSWFTFSGWQLNDADYDFNTLVTTGITLKAAWKQNYTVSWMNDDWQLIDTTEVADGDHPTHADGVQNDPRWHCQFSGWTSEWNYVDLTTEVITWPKVYTASYYTDLDKCEYQEYAVSFVDEDGTTSLGTASVKYGFKLKSTDIPTDPTKTWDVQYSYSFIGWTTGANDDYVTTGQLLDIEVTTGVTYKAVYTWIINEYLITFKNDDGTELQSGYVEYNVVPSYTGANPEKVDPDGIYAYTFYGWKDSVAEYASGSLPPVGWETVYTATYKKSAKPLVVRWNDYNDVEVDSGSYTYGKPLVVPADPVREWYIFSWWENQTTQVVSTSTQLSGSLVSEDVTYKEVWEAIKYTINFDGNGWTWTPDAMTWTYDETWYLASWYVRDWYDFVAWTGVISWNNVSYASWAEFLNLTSVNLDVITLHAEWSAHVYTATFVSNSGTAVADIPYTKESSDIVFSTSAVTTRTWYLFSGWFDNENFSGVEVTQIDAGSTWDKTFYAKWTPITYTISYNSWGATSWTMADRTMTYDSWVNLTAIGFEKEGFEFSGWTATIGWVDTGFADEQFVENLTATGDDVITLTAEWKVATYKVTYDPNGWSWSVTKEDVMYGWSYTFTWGIFSRDGYQFSGWNTEADNSGTWYAVWDVVNPWPIASWLYVYAIWTENTYTVNFDENGGIWNYWSVTTWYNETFTLPSAEFTKTWYVLTGWSEDSAATAPTYTWWQEVKSLTWENGVTVTLYAVWSPDVYQVTYYANDWTATSVSEDVIYDSSYTFTWGIFTREWYQFSGWNTESDWSGDYKSWTASWSIASWLNVYAIWTAETYTVTYDVNGWNALSPNTGSVTYGQAYWILPSPTKTNASFNGWILTGWAAVTSWTIVTTTWDHTIYAQWTDNQAPTPSGGWGGWGSGWWSWRSWTTTGAVNTGTVNTGAVVDTGSLVDTWSVDNLEGDNNEDLNNNNNDGSVSYDQEMIDA